MSNKRVKLKKQYKKGMRIKIRWENETVDVNVIGQFEEHVTVKIGKLVITVYPQEIVDDENSKP